MTDLKYVISKAEIKRFLLENFLYGDIFNLYCRIDNTYNLKELEFTIWLYYNEDLICNNSEEVLYDERDLIES